MLSSKTSVLPPCFGSRWTSVAFIGEGRYGIVHQCFDSHLDQVVALKIVKTNGQEKLADREYESFNLTKKVECEYVINLIEFVDLRNDHFIGIVMPFYKYGDLDSFIDKYFTRKGKRMSQLLICQIITQLCIAVNVAHQQNLVHCDIKLYNILVKSFDEENENYIEIVLTDFGEAFQSEETIDSHRGTRDYLPPESLDVRQYNFHVDCWCLGVVLFKLLFPTCENSIRSLLVNCENQYLTLRSTRKIEDYWKDDLEDAISSEIAKTKVEYNTLFYGTLIGLLNYRKEMRMNSLNALEFCTILNCITIRKDCTNISIGKEPLSGVLLLNKVLLEIPPNPQFEKTFEKLQKLYNNLSSEDGIQIRIKYMIGLIMLMSLLRGDFDVWDIISVSNNSSYHPQVPELVDQLEFLTTRIKRPSDKFNGHILEYLNGFVHVMNGNYNSALTCFDNSIKSFYTLLVQKLKLQLMQVDGASQSLVDEYSKLIDKHGENLDHPAFYYTKKGIALFHISRKNKSEQMRAMKDLLHARSLSPDCLAIYMLIVQRYAEMNEFQCGKQVLEQMIIRFDSSDCLNFMASNSYFELKDYNNALKYAKLLLKNYSNNSTILFYLATIYDKLNETKLELEYLEKSLEIEPLFEHALQLRLILFKKRHEFKEYEKYKREYEEMRKSNKLKGDNIPGELIPFYPDGTTPMEIGFCMFDLENDEISQMNDSTFYEQTEISQMNDLTFLEEIEIPQKEEIAKEQTCEKIILKTIKITLKNPSISVLIDIQSVDTMVEQVLSRLDTFLRNRIPNYEERTSLRTLDDDCYLITSIHQLLNYDTLLAVTSDQDQDYW